MLSQIIISKLHASDSWRASVLWIILHVNWTLLEIAECCHQQHQRLDLNTFSLRRLWEGSTAVWMMCWSYNLLSAQPHYSYEDCSCSLPNLQHHHHTVISRGFWTMKFCLSHDDSGLETKSTCDKTRLSGLIDRSVALTVDWLILQGSKVTGQLTDKQIRGQTPSLFPDKGENRCGINGECWTCT